MRHEEMEASNFNDFDWKELLDRIEYKNVIPVIGHGLYWIKKEGKEVLLYDYLADQIAEKFNVTIPQCANHRFFNAACQCLKKNVTSLRLAKELKNIIKSTELIVDNPLLKLARITSFNLFITTAYDEYLYKTIESVRKNPIERFSYSGVERDPRDDDKLYQCLKDPLSIIVYHIFGDFSCVAPSLTEKDILETIVSFQKEMEGKPRKKFSIELEKKSLLFIGCGYDDWLFRFFIRAIASENYQYSENPHSYKFVGDFLQNNKKDPFEELPRFLKNYQTHVYYTGLGKTFVDILFEKLKGDYPGIILPEAYSIAPNTGASHTAFISYHGDNKSAAINLASNLKDDGVRVWLDKNEFDPGDDIDQKIINAIENCPVFIPLLSRESKRIRLNKNRLKYHCQEWEWAYSGMRSAKNPSTIIPVTIDQTNWVYDKFKNLFVIKIPGGRRAGDYEKLRIKLLEIQDNL